MTQEARREDKAFRGRRNVRKRTTLFEKPSDVQTYDGDSEARADSAAEESWTTERDASRH
jgi:hypothetical protein